MNEDGTELHYRTDLKSPIHALKWLIYLQMRFFEPKGILLNGKVTISDVISDEVYMVIKVKDSVATIL